MRHQIAATLATLTNMDIPWAGAEAGNVGQGFPTKKLFIDEGTPMLTLNCPNPEFQGSRYSSYSHCTGPFYLDTRLKAATMYI